MSWQPMETAPKDQRILLSDADGDMQVCEWGETCVWDREGGWVYGPCDGEYNHRAEFWEPTHWMPLPEPPK